MTTYMYMYIFFIKHVRGIQQNHKNTGNNKLEAHLSLYHSSDFNVSSKFKVFIHIPIVKQCYLESTYFGYLIHIKK